MLAFSLSVALLLGVGAAQAGPAQGVHAAPFGSALRETYPDLRILFDTERPRYHVARLKPITAQATGATCEAAFQMALARLTDDARAAGGNGLIEMHSPGVEPVGAPSYACQPVETGFKVELAALAARLNGSDAPPVIPAKKPAYEAMMGRPQVRSLPPVFEGAQVYDLPVSLFSDRSTRFAGRGGSEPFIRRIHDVDAQGISENSCIDALRQALFALHKESEKFDAVGVSGVRSPRLNLVDGAQRYLCEQRGDKLVVQLTGVAAGLPL